VPKKSVSLVRGHKGRDKVCQVETVHLLQDQHRGGGGVGWGGGSDEACKQVLMMHVLATLPEYE
jgi:hypothetical protein